MDYNIQSNCLINFSPCIPYPKRTPRFKCSSAFWFACSFLSLPLSLFLCSLFFYLQLRRDSRPCALLLLLLFLAW